MIPVKQSVETLVLLAVFVFLAAVSAAKAKHYLAASLLFALLGVLIRRFTDCSYTVSAAWLSHTMMLRYLLNIGASFTLSQ